MFALFRALVLVALTNAVIGSAVRADSEKPNVVLIVIDTLRADGMSCYGYGRKTTPRLDAFAAASVQFNNAIAPAGMTPPSMAAIMTGRLPYYEAGVTWSVTNSFGFDRFRESPDDVGLPRSLDSLSELLQRHGYATGAFVTNPYVTERFQFDQGFDVLDDVRPIRGELPYHRADEVVKRSLEWLDRRDERPFFLYAHFMDVHFPYLPPEAYRSAFGFSRIANVSDRELSHAWEKQQDFPHAKLADMHEHARGLYDAGLLYADEQIGGFLDAIRERGLAENTVFVITSDHGEEFLDHGDTSHKGKLFEEHIRVPMLISLPGIKQGRVDAPVQNFDLMPTILEACGIDNPDPEMDAVSLLPLMRGGAETRGRPIFGALIPTGKNRHPHLHAIRTERYKLLHDVEVPEGSELYDLENDPTEKRNIYASKINEANRLRETMSALVSKLERETRSNPFRASDTRDEQAANRYTAAILNALNRMTPENRAVAIKAAVEKMTPEQRAQFEADLKAQLNPAELDEDMRERLEALGYVD